MVQIENFESKYGASPEDFVQEMLDAAGERTYQMPDAVEIGEMARALNEYEFTLPAYGMKMQNLRTDTLDISLIGHSPARPSSPESDCSLQMRIKRISDPYTIELSLKDFPCELLDSSGDVVERITEQGRSMIYKGIIPGQTYHFDLGLSEES